MVCLLRIKDMVEPHLLQDGGGAVWKLSKKNPDHRRYGLALFLLFVRVGIWVKLGNSVQGIHHPCK